MTRWQLAAFTAMSLLAACGGRTLDVGRTGASEGAADSGGGPAASILAGVDGGSGAPAASFAPLSVQAAEVRCGQPHGLAVATSAQTDAKALLVGSWFLCSPSSTGAAGTLFWPGISLEPDGQWYRLVSDGSGGLVRGAGVQNQGTWAVQCQGQAPFPAGDPCPGAKITIKLVADGGDTDPSGCGGGPISFENAPVRMYIPDQPMEWCSAQDPSVTIDLWFVPLRADEAQASAGPPRGGAGATR
jgi:hypothetical protein